MNITVVIHFWLYPVRNSNFYSEIFGQMIGCTMIGQKWKTTVDIDIRRKYHAMYKTVNKTEGF